MPDKRPDETNNAPEPPSIGDWTTLPESPDAKRPEAKRPSEEPPSIGDLPTLGEGAAPKHPAVEPPSIGDLPTEGEWAIRDDQRFHSRRWQPGEEILGRYVVEKELGQGGMGVVYGCFDKVGGVRVAVKALPPELSHNTVEMEEVRENFQLVDELRHPNIAGVRTLEKDARGEYFLVMDIAEGESLRKWIRRKWKAGGVTLEETIGVLRQVAAALDYAHSEKVVHRDVKPGNVMIDAKGRVKVLDFGLAAQIRTSLSRASQAYRGTSGTGPYMAPEQWKGQPQDAKADQYALGAMAYEMLSGHLPFENADVAMLREIVLKGTVRDIPNLPKGTMAALRRSMAKKAEGRFANCRDFVEALQGRSTTGDRLFPRQQMSGTRVLIGRTERWGDADTTQRNETDAKWKRKGIGWGIAVMVALIAGMWWLRPENTAKRLLPLAKRKAQNAEWMKYDEGQGFGAKMNEMKVALRRGDAAFLERDFGKAKAYFNEAIAAAEWLEKNEPWRKNAVQAREDATVAMEKASAIGGKHSRAWENGENARKSAEEAFENASFWEAKIAWDEATGAYTKAATEHHASRLAHDLAEARRHKADKRWNLCLMHANWALNLEPGNTEAMELKSHAEKQLEEVAASFEAATKEGGKTKTIMLPGNVPMEMVWCPPCTFMMNPGSSAEEVTLTNGFWIAKTEVTQAQWKSVMGDNPSHFKGDDLPVENIRWSDCTNFCAQVGMQLPTEAQWEYACRAGDEHFHASRNSGWFGEDWDKGHTHPVGMKPANAWGVYDMYGNVWEMCNNGRVLGGSCLYDEGSDPYHQGAYRVHGYYLTSPEINSIREKNCGFRPILCQN